MNNMKKNDEVTISTQEELEFQELEKILDMDPNHPDKNALMIYQISKQRHRQHNEEIDKIKVNIMVTKDLRDTHQQDSTILNALDFMIQCAYTRLHELEEIIKQDKYRNNRIEASYPHIFKD